MRPGTAQLLGILILLAPSPARASHDNTYALVVGSNRAGPGQSPLRFAHNDARQVQQVLTQLGGYSPGNTRLLLDPNPAALQEALSAFQRLLERDRQRGEPSVFIFYYSGHARARALNMGRNELPLSQLRQRLIQLPATVTIAILDACQTGAISHIKGAQPTADFSFNSVTDLNSAGLAVMASSSASELSQEADRLRGSYFTHHLVVGLRGAADSDGDGDPGVALQLEMDFLDDGSVEYSQELPSDDWLQVEYRVRTPSWYQGCGSSCASRAWVTPW